MSDEFGAIGTAVEGGLFASIFGRKGGNGADEGDIAYGTCQNCENALIGPFCAKCGQHAHVHRSISAIWHDILHAVLHFDGKMWRTLPLLTFRPGILTRRYIAGERAKFVSPIALFLFSIFMMFAIFSFIGGPFTSAPGVEDVKQNISVGLTQLDNGIAETQAQLDETDIDTPEHAKLAKDLEQLKAARGGFTSIQSGAAISDDFGKFDVKDGNANAGTFTEFTTNWPWLDNRVKKGAEKTVGNPGLMLYKLQSNGYKFAWLLIPLSLPFIWIVTLGARGHHFYDHAIFTTYSIAFMSLLFLVVAIGARLGLSPTIIALIFILIPPIHLYKQLRYSYEFGRVSTILRLCAMLVSILVIILLFLGILMLLGFLS